MNVNRTTYCFLVACAGCWCAMILAAPLFTKAGSPVGSLLYEFFSHVCHQMDERSFHLGGAKFAVCIRCTTIYASLFLSLLVLPLISPLRRLKLPPAQWLLMALVPMLVDAVLNDTGVHISTTASRIVTGALAGFVLPFYIVPPLAEAVSKFRNYHFLGGNVHARKTE